MNHFPNFWVKIRKLYNYHPPLARGQIPPFHLLNHLFKSYSYFALFIFIILTFDKVPDTRSWWNFQEIYPGTFFVPWHHLQLNQEHACPAKLQEETWMIGGVLTNFLMLDLDETFCKASQGYLVDLDTISSSIKNITVIQGSRKRLGG